MNEQTPETDEVSLDRYILEPNDEIVDALINHWSWIFEDDISIVMMSRLGDFFLEDDNGIIYWLNTGTGELDRIAASDAEFQQLLQTESFDDWFLTDLVDECHAAGLVPGDGEVLSYKILPIFEEGEYTVENMHVISAEAHLEYSGVTVLELVEEEEDADQQ
jgi:ribosomal protein L16 Arg81 hydroxylase